MRSFVSLLLVVVLAVPIAQAQGESDAEWVIPEGPHRLAPETATSTLNLTFRYHCDLRAAEPAQLRVQISTTDVPPYAVAVPNPASTSTTPLVVEEDWCGAPDQYLEVPLTVTVTTSRDAPAYVPFSVGVKALVEYASDQGTDTDGPFYDNVTYQATFFPLIQAVPVQTRLKVAPDTEVRFPIDVTNFGNGPTRIHAEVEQTSANRLDAVIPPPPIVLPSRPTDGHAAATQQQVAVVVRAPDTALYANEIHALKVEFTGSYAHGDDDKSNNQTVFLSLQVQGTVSEAPAPALLVGLAAVAAALVVARRRQ